MKRKIIVLLITILFITGCTKKIYEPNNINTINYNLNIADYYYEKIIALLPVDAYNIAQKSINDDIESLEHALLLNDSYPLLNDNDIIYNKKISSINNNYKVKLEYEFIENDYINSTFINTCFENKSIIQEDNYIEINLSGLLYCYIDKTINIYVTTNHKVIESNGIKENNTCHWKIDNTNNDNVSIHYKISRLKSSMQRDYSEDYSQLFSFIKLFCYSIIILVLIIIYKKKNK